MKPFNVFPYDSNADFMRLRWFSLSIAGLLMLVSFGAMIFHAGTTLDAEGRVVTAGGRVLCVTALGDTVAEAQRHAYAGVAAISWANEFHRSDIGWRAIARERGEG